MLAVEVQVKVRVSLSIHNKQIYDFTLCFKSECMVLFCVKVRPSNQMCRDASGECDVPEFCDGATGNVSRGSSFAPSPRQYTGASAPIPDIKLDLQLKSPSGKPDPLTQSGSKAGYLTQSGNEPGLLPLPGSKPSLLLQSPDGCLALAHAQQ